MFRNVVVLFCGFLVGCKVKQPTLIIKNTGPIEVVLMKQVNINNFNQIQLHYKKGHYFIKSEDWLYAIDLKKGKTIFINADSTGISIDSAKSKK